MAEEHNFQILSLDGGGIRGIFTAAILQALEEDLHITICDHFDLISGTSTGGIIALGLGLGLSPKEILDFYFEKSSEIFGESKNFFSQKIYNSKYSNEGLKKSLQKVFQTKKLGDSTKRLVIPSYSLLSDNVYVFRTAHAERLKRDSKIEAWKVGLATASAPTFFPTCDEVDRDRLIDGGVWANNPTMVALTESFGTLKIPLEKTKICSLGTAKNRKEYPKNLNRGSDIAWAFQISDLFLNAQSNAAINQAEFFVGSSNFQRINFVFGGKEVSLDAQNIKHDLYAAAKSIARESSPRFEKLFLEHKAPAFVPHNMETLNE